MADGKAGAPKGNKNSQRGKIFRHRLIEVLDSYQEGDVKSGQALEQIVRVLVRTAIQGEEWAVREIANRLDGKPQESGKLDAQCIVRMIRGDEDL